MYFDLGNEWGTIQNKYNLTNDEMFDFFNVPALEQTVKEGKEIRFSHKPDYVFMKKAIYLKNGNNYKKTMGLMN